MYADFGQDTALAPAEIFNAEAAARVCVARRKLRGRVYCLSLLQHVTGGLLEGISRHIL